MTLTVTNGVLAALKRLSTDNNVISALAIDQRGSLKKMIAKAANQPANETEIVHFKEAIAEELTPYSSAILLDPEYGLPASKVRDQNAGLLLAYEKTGYDATEPGRFPDLLDSWSARRLKDAGADAIKFLLYYDVDESEAINDRKHAFVERVGAEAAAVDLPFFLELVSYDGTMDSVTTAEYAKIKPHKVNAMTAEFSKPKYGVTVLKVEVPVNMKFVEGYTDAGTEIVYTQEQAKVYFKEQSEATDLPFIFLSAGVTNELFLEELKFAKDADSSFNGVLCGRATWKPGVEPYAAKGDAVGREWLRTEGKANIERLNEVLATTASSWTDKITAE
ncbi:tagatose 1,6-diphosphate aldolase [Loigolactobacillus coryniformis]|uniref:tagatose 1,6-diphosphate aldolase n=1 Tax=Loigolactobacillus coryniformis TaxID=1610 RepID=UPI001C5EFB37|nr:tagatose 1,6-diphosphate aldolase [Loigolactobacillus coryniformis]MBW4803703.1 tagatose 1,6-diphosphate aldolase [Loigolactobacillus coryniformis subsp. torquens]MBW4806405.1 tagatose 1,6-diphosphate aldolase [Loigolactobacillus coryniformis subsp. torquens]